MKGLLRRYGIKIRKTHDPSNEAAWRNVVQLWKQNRLIRDAYAAAGVRLIDRPQDLSGKDWHPERRCRKQGCSHTQCSQ